MALLEYRFRWVGCTCTPGYRRPDDLLLMIDDNPQNRRYIEKMIHYLCVHKIATTENANEAIESMVARRPEVILLDLFIPGMDGF